jgi:RNA polymerase sigma-70 factor (ECF subfamily)
MVGDGLVEAGGRSARAAAFVRLADSHLDASYRLATAILGNRAEAEDATQDALIQAWRHWSQLRDHGRFEHWFDRILVNTCRNRLRRSNRWPTDDLSSELASSGGDPIGHADDRDQMRDALIHLTPDHRVVIALRFYLDLPISEIASRLRVPEGTVNSRLHYALEQLRGTLREADATGADR